MALTKSEKEAVINEVGTLLTDSKMTVVVKYQGTSVKSLQALRREASQNGTVVKVVKNRLFIQAMKQQATLKGAATDSLEGMLLYAFNSEDEVAPAHVLNTFAKTNPSIEFVGAFSADGEFIDAAGVKSLAGLPSKQQLIAEVIAQLLSPVHDTTNALSGNLHGLLDGIEAKAT